MDYRSWRSQLIQEGAKKRIPILGEFEITSACNLACEMCYMSDHSLRKEKTTAEWKELFKTTADAGMVFALLTGGEIFMRKDFVELYEYLFDLGVRITLFTNGTMLNDAILQSLLKRRPDYVAITLYGASNETYEVVTKNKHGFDWVNQAIDKLKAHRIPILLRTIPIRPIVRELEAVIAYAKSKDIALGYSLYVGPTRERCHQELGLRLEPLELIEFERRMRESFGLEPEQDFLENQNQSKCAALRSGFYLDHRFHLMACAMLNHPKKQITPDTFLQTFHELGDVFEALDQCDACHACDTKSSCIQCYARRFLEGNAKTCHPYLKAIAKLRRGTRHETN